METFRLHLKIPKLLGLLFHVYYDVLVVTKKVFGFFFVTWCQLVCWKRTWTYAFKNTPGSVGENIFIQKEVKFFTLWYVLEKITKILKK